MLYSVAGMSIPVPSNTSHQAISLALFGDLLVEAVVAIETLCRVRNETVFVGNTLII